MSDADLLAELERVREESAQRWEAIGRLAPAAKAYRERAEAAHRLLAEVRVALAAPLDDAARLALAARIDAVLGRPV
jgi:F0F1-type ATP synthase delta subunit